MARRSRSLWLGVLGFIPLCVVPTAARAQLSGCPSYIEITVSPSSPVNQRTANITVEYGEDQTELCLSYANTFDLETFVFKVDDSVVTEYFDVGAWQAIGTNVPLHDDELNDFHAEILGWDEDDNPVTNTDYANALVDWTPAPAISSGPYEYFVQDLGRCAASCFQVVQTYTTVPYFTMDQPQAVTLVYHGDRANARPILQFDVTRPTGQSGVPTKYRFQAQIKSGQDWATQTFTNGELTIHYDVTSSTTVRLKGQLADTGRATEVYDLRIIAGLYYGAPDNKWADQTWETKLVWVNEQDASVARGWTIGGEQRVHEQPDTSVLITDGWGNAVYYTWTNGSFTTPNGEFSKLTVAGSQGSRTFTRRYPDSTKVIFDDTGFLTEVKDRFANTWTFHRDGANRLTEIRDPLYSGSNLRRIQLNYGANGLSSMVDLGGRTTTVTVDGSRLLTRIKDPGGDSTKFSYAADSLGYRMTAVRDRRGYTTDFFYGLAWKLDSIMAPQVAIYGEGNERPTVRFTPWQPVGMATGSTSSTPWTPAKGDTIHAETTDAESQTTQFTVNKWGQPLVTTNPLAQTTTVVYDVNGSPTSIAHPSGGTDTYSYNSDGLVTAATPAGGPTTNIRYHTTWRTQPDSIWGTEQVSEWRGIGTNGRVDSVVVAGLSQFKTKFTYETDGRVKSQTDPGGHLIQVAYTDSSGNTTAVTYPTRVATYGYDTFGRQTWVQRAYGTPRDSVQYDSVNRVIKAFRGGQPTATVFSYDNPVSGGTADTVTDVLGQRYTSVSNAVGWLIEREDPAGRSDTYQYNRNGHLRRWTNRRGQHNDTEYDVLGRPTKTIVRHGADSTVSTFGYNTGAGANRVWRSNPYQTDTTFLNIRGQPDSVATVLGGRAYEFKYAYRTNGLPDSVMPTGTGASFLTRSYTYHGSHWSLTSIRLAAKTTTIAHDDEALADTVTFPGGDKIASSHTSSHRTSRRSTAASYNQTIWRAVEQDVFGRIHRHQALDLVEGREGSRFVYDSLGRVVIDSLQWRSDETCEEDVDWGEQCEPETDWDFVSRTTFAYDSIGNRTDQGGTYQTGNRITAFASCTYATDYDGNVTSRTDCPTGTEDVRFHWRSDNRLRAMKLLSGSADSLDFFYDASGRLVRQDVNGDVSRYFLWNGANLFAEFTDSGSKIAEYSYYPGLDHLHALVIDTIPYFAHADGLGNVIALTDEAKTVQRQYTYDDIWGTGSDASGSLPCPMADCDRARFKGALYLAPEAGLYYMRNRWYEARTGRFLSEDPIGLEGGINQYAFAASDAVNGRDPLGLCTLLTLAADDAGGWLVVARGSASEGDVHPQLGGFWAECRGGNWVRLGWSLFGTIRTEYGSVGFDRIGGGLADGLNNLGLVRCSLPALSSQVSSPFGDTPREFGGSDPHIGIDYVAPIGTRVPSKSDGLVTDVTFGHRHMGNVVTVWSGDTRYRYMHLSQIFVLPGWHVARLNLIGYSGDTGGVDPHLHVDAYRNGRFVNPAPCVGL